jgi:DNA modification methylase
LSDNEVFQVFMAENLNRQDFTPLEIGVFLKHALEVFGWSQRQLAKNLGQDPAWVNRHLRLLDLPRPVQSLLTHVNGGLAEGHARLIFGLNRTEQIAVANTVVSKKLTVRQTEMLVRRMKTKPTQENMAGLREPRNNSKIRINDLVPNRWKQYSKDYYLQTYSVWRVTRRHDPFYGIPGTLYPGSFPVIVPLNCLLRYSKRREVVLDPFVGGATTLQACAMLERYGIGVDINPEAKRAMERRFALLLEKRPSMRRRLNMQKFVTGDSRDLSFIPDSYVDLVLAHPPYANMMDYGQKGTHSDVRAWQVFLQDCLTEIARVLKAGRFLCVQIAPYASRHLPLHHIAYGLALKAGFEFADEIVLAFLDDYVGYSSSATGRDTPIVHKEAFSKWFSIARNVYNYNHEYLLIFRKPG